MNIFTFAMQKEVQSEAMYRKLAKAAVNKGMKTIFTMLADSEKQHYETVVKMEKDEKAELSECKVLDDSREIMSKFRAEKLKFKLDSSQIEIYKEAQEIEKVSEQFYREKARETKYDHHKKLLLSLAEEEFNHFTILEEIIEMISSPESRLESAEFNKR
ncbi:MAG: ferritin family protein [Candidatus Riflebacteria bacterium]|nr:ferritin family protein [Candidatus Riflebacteria bacterium]